MSIYMRSCNKCGKMQPLNIEYCACGADLSMVIPVMVNRYQVCRQCGSINNVPENKKCVDLCNICGDINIYAEHVYVDVVDDDFGDKDSVDKQGTSVINDDGDENRGSDIDDEIDSANDSCMVSDSDEATAITPQGSILFIDKNVSVNLEETGNVIGRSYLFAKELQEYRKVSREHLWIDYIASINSWTIKNVGLNRARLNGSYIESGKQVPIKNGDIISLSEARFKFTCSESDGVKTRV